MNTKFFPQWLRLAAGLILLLAALAPVNPVYADSCLVTTDADSGAGSLREKIAYPLCDTITFDGDYTIVLASQLIVSRSVTIAGVGQGVTVSGNHAVRVFYIDAGVTVNLNNLTVANGTVNTSGVGGGIYNRGALNVMNSTFSGNSAGMGGGIYSDGDALTVTGSIFTDNSATMDGSGLHNHIGTANVANSSFSNNSAGWDGGGIYNGGTLNVTNGVFSRNLAQNGAGIYIDLGTASVTDSTFTDNFVNWEGGGIYVNSAVVTVAGSNFNSNGAECGPAIHNDGTLSVTNTAMTGGRAQYCGGGIYNTGTLDLTNSTISGNRVDFGTGGGIFNRGGMVTSTNTTITNNLGSFGGGAIINSAGTVIFTNSTLSGNWAGDGSGILSDDGGTATFLNTIINNPGTYNCAYQEGALTGTNNLADDETCGPGFSVSPSILLGPLADNGGPTQTMALLPASTAIDSGDDAVCPASDQRGVTRPRGAHCDIGAYEAEITTGNTAPTANPGGPYLGAVNTSILFDGSGSSDPDSDPLTYAWSFGDGATDSGVAPTRSYTAAGVYNVCLTVSDGALDSTQACTMAVVYDPSAGFVTGGGAINSPAGAYQADETLTGKATFGFISKYQKGASVPTGNTAFQFDLAGLAFSSESYEWLVVSQAGTTAQFKGSGLINGAPDPNGSAYKFMLWAGDGSPDTFRIRIWWEDATGEHDVYDNGAAQAIGAGNIVVHTGK